jgi:hypothetical protein
MPIAPLPPPGYSPQDPPPPSGVLPPTLTSFAGGRNGSLPPNGVLPPGLATLVRETNRHVHRVAIKER